MKTFRNPLAARQPVPAKPPAAPPGGVGKSEADFFVALGLCMGLAPAEAQAFRSSMVFKGPAGLPCKVVWQSANGAGAARPEILLPLSADELFGPDVRQLLTVQALLLSEFDWYLGLSGEGLLQIIPLGWMDQPADVAAALDVGHLLAATVLAYMSQSTDSAGPTAK